MSRWVRGIYNTAANFNLSNALRATGLGRLGRNDKQLQTESDKSNECGESDKPCQSNQSNKHGQHSCPSHPTRTCNCPAGTCDDDNYIGNKGVNLHVEGCICSLCRDYNEYVNATSGVRTEGQGSGSRIRFSDESRNFKQSNPDATRTDVEYITGIRTGVTI
jgi:hypothetical protein